MKKEILGLLIFLATLAAVSIPLVMLAIGAPTDTFSSNVTVGNSPPNITYVNNSFSINPSAATTREVVIRFNATDNNSASDFNDATAEVNITLDGVTRTSHTCTPEGLAGVLESWECNITINYWEKPGNWNITAYVEDTAGNSTMNDTYWMTVGNADHIDVIETALSFSGSAGQQNRPASENPLTINNTGNQNYTIVNITGTVLSGGGDNIGPSNFTVNVTDGSGEGEALSTSVITIASAVIDRRTGASSTEDLYFYLDIPSGIANTDYSTGGSPWTIDPSV